MENLTVRHLSFTYPQCSEKALEDLSFSVKQGEFLTLCGATGSGKSTLMRLLKRELAPVGALSGEILWNGTPLAELDERTAACRIGYVMQRPEQQLVTDRVWHELAFGLENMGLPTDIIRRRVSEIACYFGIEDWFEKNVSELSGGQKQLLNLASVLVMQPDLLLLDEPTAQLDPIAAADFISTVSRINRELSLTVILIEHRLEEVLPVSDRLLVLEKGKMLRFGETRQVVGALRELPEVLEGMPAAVRLFSRLETSGDCPMTVREGRNFLEAGYRNEVRSLPAPEKPARGKPVLEFRDVCFRYARELPDVLAGLNLTVYENEFFCILGGNGSGKSTALSAAAGLLKPYAGSISVLGKKLQSYKNQSLYRECLTLLPQDVQTVFLRNSVREELEGVDTAELPFDLTGLYDRHPYDLSGGQQQLLGLAKVLATRPRLLLLDEPTKGLDAHTRNLFLDILRQLKAKGVTLVCVTHDMEFAAEAADRCALFFRGEITSCEAPGPFFAGNSFYTTAANRITRGFYENVATVGEAETLCRRNGRKI